MKILNSDAVKLVLQFLKEHNLIETMKALEKESNVTLNTVDSIPHFVADIENGKACNFDT